jgi:hypothetical protein
VPFDVTLVERDGSDRRHDLVAGDDVRQPRARGATRVLRDTANRDDHRQPDRQRANGQRGPAAVSHDRAAREPLFETQDGRERQAGDATERREKERRQQGHEQQQRVDGKRADERRVSATWPDRDPHRTHRDEHRDEPAQPRTLRTRRLGAELEGFDGRDPAGAPGGLERGGDRHDEPRAERDDECAGRQLRPVGGDAADGSEIAADDVREDDPDEDADRRTGDAKRRRRGEDEARDLPPGRARGTQEAHLPDPLCHCHRYGVEDEERADEQREPGDERRRRLEIGRRGAERCREVGGRRDAVRLGGEIRRQRPLDVRGREPVGEPDVDAARAVEPEDARCRVDRQDHGSAQRADDRPVARDDADDAELLRVTRGLDGQLAVDRVAIVFGEPLRDHRVRLVTTKERRARDDVQVVDIGIHDGIDAEHRDRRGHRVRRIDRRAQVGPLFDDWRGYPNAQGVSDRAHGVRRETSLLEGRNAEVGVADEVLDRPVDRVVDAGVDGEGREQHRDAESDPDDREDRPEPPHRNAPPRERRQPPHVSEPQLGEPADERAGVVAVAAAQLDLFEDSAVLDHQNAVGVRRGLRVVGDEDDGLTAFDARPPQRVEDAAAGGVVEVAGGLVGEEQSRSGHERARHGDPLLLAGGQLIGLDVRLGRQVDEPDDVGDPAGQLTFARIEAGDRERQGNVLGHVEQRDEVEELKDETRLLAA